MKRVGQICAKGPLIVKGYAGDPVATSTAIDKDNWLHTGDVGYYDDEGYFYIVHRRKELIKHEGYQVSPAELEGPDEFSGELPLAFVVCRKSWMFSDKLSPQKHLRGGVRKNVEGRLTRRAKSIRSTGCL